MRPTNLDVALAGENAHRRLRAEIDEFPPEVAFVLRHILVQRRRQPRIVPCCRLRVVVNEVYAGCVSKAHLPATGQRAELRHGLLLDGTVASVVAVHPDVLLSPWVDPCCRSSVVINEIRTTFRSMPHFPTRR